MKRINREKEGPLTVLLKFLLGSIKLLLRTAADGDVGSNPGKVFGNTQIDSRAASGHKNNLKC